MAAVAMNGCSASMVFTVADPSLDIKIWDYNQNTDVTGKSVPQGEMLGFRIDTNMYPAVDSSVPRQCDRRLDHDDWLFLHPGDFAINNLLNNYTNSVWNWICDPVQYRDHLLSV